MLERPYERLERLTLTVRAGALAAFISFPSGPAMSLDMDDKVGKPLPAISSHKRHKPAPRANSLRPGNYYQDFIVYCRDSNDVITYFCFWIAD